VAKLTINPHSGGISITAKKRKLKEKSVEELFDDLLDTQPRVETKPAEDPWGDDYQSKLMKKEARMTIERYRKDEPIKVPDRNPPVTSQKMQSVTSCKTCYYCTAIKKIGGSWWCRCTNPARSGQNQKLGHDWVKGWLGLPCWRGNENA
jgi:hypothetical protein